MQVCGSGDVRPRRLPCRSGKAAYWRAALPLGQSFGTLCTKFCKGTGSVSRDRNNAASDQRLSANVLRACGLCFATEGGSGPGAVDDRHRERRSPSSSPKQSCAITGPSPPRQPICGRRSVQSPAVPDKLLLRTLPAEGLALCKLSDVRVGWQAIKTAALVTMPVGHLPQGSMHLNILTPEFI